MSQTQTFTRIVMPQVVLATAPSIVNQFTVIVKSSTLVSVITVPDLMSQSQKLVNVWYEPIEILTATAAIYIFFFFFFPPRENLGAPLPGRPGVSEVSGGW